MIPSQPFGSLKKLFDETANAVLKEKWGKLHHARFWYDVLPRPDLSKFVERPTLVQILGVIPYHGSNPNLEWQNWATDFFNSYSRMIDRKLNEMKQNLEEETSAWNSKNYQHKKLLLNFDKIYSQWLGSIENVPLISFCSIDTGEKAAENFLLPKKTDIRNRFEVKPASDGKSKVKKESETPFIRLEARDGLINDLKQYVNEIDHNSLISLISGKHINTTITIHCKQNTVGKIFYLAYKNKCTDSSKKAFANWICKHFQRSEKNELVNLTVSTMYNHLKGIGISKA